MSATPTPTPPQRPRDPDSLLIVSHSQLVYWWPVWAFGFLFGLITWFQGYTMVVVPPDSKALHDVTIQGTGQDHTHRDVIVLDKEKRLPAADPGKPDGDREQPHIRVSPTRSMGVLFSIILLLVIIITNVPLRGLWSVIIIIGIILLALIFQLAGWWDEILRSFSLLDIRINAGGYIFISTVLFIAWLVTLMIFDRQIYIVFTPGQLKVCNEIGGGEKVYDAMGLHLEKQRSDLFRHWILGLGSGDLIVKTGGAQPQQFDLPNVLFIGRKVAQIEDLMKRKMTMEVKS